jgi:hypothetical protein
MFFDAGLDAKKRFRSTSSRYLDDRRAMLGPHVSYYSLKESTARLRHPEAAVPRALFAEILRRIDRLTPRPLLT